MLSNPATFPSPALSVTPNDGRPASPVTTNHEPFHRSCHGLVSMAFAAEVRRGRIKRSQQCHFIQLFEMSSRYLRQLDDGSSQALDVERCPHRFNANAAHYFRTSELLPTDTRADMEMRKKHGSATVSRGFKCENAYVLCEL